MKQTCIYAHDDVYVVTGFVLYPASSQATTESITNVHTLSRHYYCVCASKLQRLTSGRLAYILCIPMVAFVKHLSLFCLERAGGTSVSCAASPPTTITINADEFIPNNPPPLSCGWGAQA